MKKLNLILSKKLSYLMFLTCAMVLLGCDKKDEQVEPASSIVGTWELRHTLGVQDVDVEPGNGNTITFTADTYQKKRDGEVVDEGRYSVKDESVANIDGTDFNRRIVFDGNMLEMHLKFSENVLVLSFGSIALDGGTYTYERVVGLPID